MKNERRILVVEDALSLRESLKTVLRNSGYIVDLAADGEEALSSFKKHAPSLILLDILLPGRDGLEILSEIRKMRGGKDVCVIVITQFNEKEQRERAKALGVAVYFVKANISLSDLLDAVSRVIKAGAPAVQSKKKAA